MIMKKQSPWEGGHKASQDANAELTEIIARIVDDSLIALAIHAGHLDARNAFGVVMTAIDAIASTGINAFAQDDLEEAKRITTQHACNIMRRIIARTEGETLQ
jgi:hypothetical protein